LRTKKRRPGSGDPSRLVVLANAKKLPRLQLARAAADGRVVEAHVAAAAVLAALADALAASLELLAAFLVAAGAGDAAAVFGLLALAMATGEVALADADAVFTAAATAATFGQHAAEILQRALGHFVLAAAIDLEAALALLELHRAARHALPVGVLRRARGGVAGLPAGLRSVLGGRHRGGTLQQSRSSHQ